MTEEFKGKINHLKDNLDTILTSKYQDGQKLAVTFYRDTSNGIHDNIMVDSNNNEYGSLLSYALNGEIKNKFSNLFNDEDQDANSLSFIIQKQDGKIINKDEFEQFIQSITFYLVMFNSIGIIQEGAGKDGKVGLIVSQRELHDLSYLFQLSALELSPTGQQILSEHQAGWNRDRGNRIVWNYEDCWPINLFNDAPELINIMHWKISKLSNI